MWKSKWLRCGCVPYVINVAWTFIIFQICGSYFSYETSNVLVKKTSDFNHDLNRKTPSGVCWVKKHRIFSGLSGLVSHHTSITLRAMFPFFFFDLHDGVYKC